MILLSAGHRPGAKGASFGDLNEHDEATRWVGQLSVLLRQRTHVEIVPTGNLPAKIKFINDYDAEKVDLAIEIHFNSDPLHKGRGSETLYCPDSVNGKRAAQIVQTALGKIFTPDRGIKEGWYKMIVPPNPRAVPDAFLRQSRPTALIVEPEFIHNRSIIESMRSIGCETLADAIVEASQPPSNTPGAA